MNHLGINKLQKKKIQNEIALSIKQTKFKKEKMMYKSAHILSSTWSQCVLLELLIERRLKF